MQLEMGSATVPVAPVGVPPTGSTRFKNHRTVRPSCAGGFSARRRKLRAGRPRSPVSTAWFRLTWLPEEDSRSSRWWTPKEPTPDPSQEGNRCCAVGRLNPNSEMENHGTHGTHGRMRSCEPNLAAGKSSAPAFASPTVSVCSVSSVVSTPVFGLNRRWPLPSWEGSGVGFLNDRTSRDSEITPGNRSNACPGTGPAPPPARPSCGRPRCARASRSRNPGGSTSRALDQAFSRRVRCGARFRQRTPPRCP